MTKSSYAKYLESPHWRSFRASVLCSRPQRCQQCSVVGEPLELHHDTYERLGTELEADVRLLCRICHGSQHFDKIESPKESAFSLGRIEHGRRRVTA